MIMSYLADIYSTVNKYGDQQNMIQSVVSTHSAILGDINRHIDQAVKNAFEDALKGNAFPAGVKTNDGKIKPPFSVNSPGDLKANAFPAGVKTSDGEIIPPFSVNSPPTVMTRFGTPDGVKSNVVSPAGFKTPDGTPAAVKTSVAKTPAPEKAAKATNEKEPGEANGRVLRNNRKTKATEVKKNLVLSLDASNLADFVSVSPAKAEVPNKDKRVLRGDRKKADAAANMKKEEEEGLTKKEIAAKRKEAAELKKRLKKEEAELKKKKVELKKEDDVTNQNADGKTKRIPRPGVIRVNLKIPEDSETTSVTILPEGIPPTVLPESDEDEEEKIRSARIKELRERNVILGPKGCPSGPGSAPLARVFPYIGDNGMTCMRKNVEPSTAIYDPLAPVSPEKMAALQEHLKQFEGMEPRQNADDECSFFQMLTFERTQWPDTYFGWLFDNHLSAYVRVLIRRTNQDPTPFWSKRIAFVDTWFQSQWIRDYEQFRIKPRAFKWFELYVEFVNGRWPSELKTNLSWLKDVDHLYGVLHTGSNHWVAYHVDLWKEKIDCYDPIIGQVTPESEKKIHSYFRPLTEMIPVMMNDLVPHEYRKPSMKQFAFRRRKAKNIPQNIQVGDCGVYSLKFIECLALGVAFDGINDDNIQGIRVNMAADILEDGGYKSLLTISR